MTQHRSYLLAVLCVVFLATSAFADDPPARVARLNYLTGQVSIQPNGVEEWVAASINRPLTSSDRLWTDRDSRAELQLGGASLRTNDETSMTLVNVSDNNVQIQLDQGTMNLHVTELFDGEVYEVDTPNVSFVVRKKGDYRLDVDNAGDTTKLTVFRGEGEVTGDGPALRVGKDESYTFNQGRSLRYATANHNPGRDGFDDWCLARTDREDRAVSARYVSRYTVGYSDLDDYGYWESVPTYGSIWIPRTVSVGWAPYRYGHWIWVSPWGWTWVDDAPWGFAPYHYGRWVQYGRGWGWCPGPIHVRPIYAPALVGWIGGARWGVGLSFGIGGGVGWFPLGWGDPYIPYYGHSRRYFQNVNISNTHITNITYVTNNYFNRPNRNDWHYANRENTGAVTAVSNDTFRNSRPTRNGVVQVNEHELKQASVERNIGLRPTTNSMLGEHAGDARRTPPPTMARPTRNAPGSNPVVGDRGRPVAPAARETVNAPAQPAGNVEVGRPGRGIPRPNDNSNSMATTPTDRRPEAAIKPEAAASQPSGSTIVMPSRVPRPGRSEENAESSRRSGRDAPSSLSQPIHSYSHTDATPPAPNVNATRPERSVPRPTEGQVIRQDPRPMDTRSMESRPAETQRPERIDRGVQQSAPAREERRSNDVPRSNENVNVGRPSRSEAPEVHSAPPPRQEAPRTETPHSAPPPPAPRQAEPAHQNNKPEQSRPPREERKVQPNNNGGSASLRYPSPQNSGQSFIRPASMRSSYVASNSFSNSRSSYSASQTRPLSYRSSGYRSSAYRSSTFSSSPAHSSVSRSSAVHSSVGRSAAPSSSRSASRVSSGGGTRRRG